MSDYLNLRIQKALLKRALADVNLSLDNRARIRRKIDRIKREIRVHQENSGFSRDLDRYVDVGSEQPVPTRYARLNICTFEVQFKTQIMPPDVFEQLIRHLFERYLNDKPEPEKVAIGFRILPNGDNYYIPLRPAIFNTYAMMAREVLNRVQSENNMIDLRGIRIAFKLTIQFAQNQLRGGCLNNRRPSFSSDIDVSDSSNSYCLFYSILGGIKRLSIGGSPLLLERKLKKWAESKNLLSRVAYLLKESGCPANRSSYTLKHAELVQTYLHRVYPNKYQLVIVNLNQIVYKGAVAKHIIPLRLYDEHFTLIKNINSALGGTNKYCVNCESKAYRYHHNAACEYHCKQCKRYGWGFPCQSDGIRRTCADCNLNFYNQECYEYHRKAPSAKLKPLCKHIYLCNCGRVRNTFFKHICAGATQSSDKCKKCGVKHDPAFPNVCYIPKYIPKDSYPIRYYFYDIESEQIEHKHVANLVVAHQICSICLDNNRDFEEEPSKKCFCAAERRRVFENFDENKLAPIHQFLYWVMKQSKKPEYRQIAIAHNSSRYDSHLIFEGALEMGLTPDLVLNGLKMFSMKIHGRDLHSCKFIDSLNFLLVPLSKLPRTFNLSDDLSKLYFPHAFNLKANLNVELSHLPPKEYYGMEHRSAEENAKFNLWYEANCSQSFCLRRDLIEYCEVDVRILREACCKFRQLIMSLTKLDPFAISTTIASLTMKIYQTLFLKERSLVCVPEGGYRSFDPQSLIARRWLSWYSHKNRVTIQSCDSAGGEYKVKIGERIYKLDGVIRNVSGRIVRILEFAGCYMHGCLCYTNRNQRLVGGKSAEQLYAELNDRCAVLRRHFGCPVEVKWQCEFQQELLDNPEIEEYLNKIEFCDPMNPRRDVLRGGRVEVFRLIHECSEEEEIVWVDLISLYPFVMKTGAFPEGHPNIIVPEKRDVLWTKRSDCPYRGLIYCKVLPPEKLIPPLLPYRSASGMLLFVLCRTCAEEGSVVACTHRPDERSWWSGFTSFELLEALDLGYRVVGISEIWHWDSWCEGANSMFSDFVNLFLTLKVTNSGFPHYIDAIEDANQRVSAKLAYIEEYQRREGIRLQYHEIEYNEAKRYIAKIILNSLWGRYCMRADTIRVEIIQTSATLNRLLNDESIEIHDVIPLNETILYVKVKDKKEKGVQSNTNNVPLGAFVTSYARLHLYKYLKAAGLKCIYCDTDSGVIFKLKNEPLPFEVGMFLGQMSREYIEYDIIAFVSGGPKNYSIQLRHRQTGEIKYVVKVRGFSQTLKSSEVLNFESIKNLILERMGDLEGGSIFPRDEASILSTEYLQFKRNVYGEIHSYLQKKNYRFSCDKGVISKDFVIKPYGFKE